MTGVQTCALPIYELIFVALLMLMLKFVVFPHSRAILGGLPRLAGIYAFCVLNGFVWVFVGLF